MGLNGLRYSSGVFQQASSAVSTAGESLEQEFSSFAGVLMLIPMVGFDCYELNTGYYAAYGFEYEPGSVDNNGVYTFLPASTLSNH